jgi:glucose-6-phosphate isomerase
VTPEIREALIAKRALLIVMGQSGETQRTEDIEKLFRDMLAEAGVGGVMATRPISMVKVLGGLSEVQAKAVYDALAQWADNEANFLMDADERDVKPADAERLSNVQAVVEALELELVALAD